MSDRLADSEGPLVMDDAAVRADALVGGNPTVLWFIARLVRRARLVSSVGLIGTLMFVLYTAITREYVAETLVRPQGAAAPSQLVAVASSFGFQVGSEHELSPAYVATVVRSRGVLVDLARTEFPLAPTTAGGDSLAGDLVAILKLHASSPHRTTQRAVRELRRRVQVALDAETGVVTITTRAPRPELAEAMGRRILELLETFTRERRQSRYRAERVFVQDRLDSARAELEEAEADVRRFLEANREVASPGLRLELDRLSRRVDVRQQVYLTLAQAHEQARIEEVRNTPVLTVVDVPEGSSRPSMRLARAAAVGATGSLLLALATAFGIEYLAAQRRAGSPEFAELREALRRAGGMPRRWGPTRKR